VEGLELPPDQLLAIGERELREARKRYDEAMRAIENGRPGADAWKMIEEDHARPEELLPQAQALVDQVVSFTIGQHLLTLPTPRRRVAEMPPVLWGFVVLSEPGPLETRARDSLLYVDPVDKGWAERHKLDHLRTLNRPTLVVTVAHELVGHYALAERN